MRLSSLLRCVLVCLLVVACGTESRDVSKFAFVSPGGGNPFFDRLVEAARQEVRRSAGVELQVLTPAVFANLEQQVELVDAAIASEVDVLCIVPVDSKGIAPALRRAQDAGMRIVLVDNDVDSAAAAAWGLKPMSRVRSDNRSGGALAAEAIRKAIGDSGHVGVLDGIEGDVARSRFAGFEAGLSATPTVVIASRQSARFSRADAVNVMRGMIAARPQLRAVFALNDEMALGAARALSELRREGSVLIVGYDATPDGIEAVRDGRLLATIEQSPDHIGRTAGALARRLASVEAAPVDTMVLVRLVTRDSLP